MSRPHQCKMAPHSQKKCPNNGSYHHLGLDVCATLPRRPQIATMDNELGLETCLEPPMYVFFSFLFLFFMLTWNFNEIDYVIWHHHHQLHLDESTMSTYQDSTLQHKKMPKWWLIPLLGPQYAHCKFHITTWLQITTMDNERGLETGFEPPMYAFIFLLFLY